MDGDYDLDVLVASWESVAWWENDGSQSFAERAVSNAEDYTFGALAVDLDQDGDVDVVVCDYYDYDVNWYLCRADLP